MLVWCDCPVAVVVSQRSFKSFGDSVRRSSSRRFRVVEAARKEEASGL